MTPSSGISNKQVAKNPELTSIVKILLVDDRPENLLTLESILTSDNRIFYKAESGNEALKIALNESLTIIMMDIQMPEMDGIETSRLLRLNPRTRHIPILFVSAINPKEKYPLVGFEPGTVDFLFKPLDIEDTRTKVAIFENLVRTNNELQEMKKKTEHLTTDFNRFVYMVSHDLKTPLRALTNLASWIEEEMPENSPGSIKENLSLLKDRVLRMNLMIDGVLEYSRVGRIQEQPERIDVRKLVHTLFESLQPSSGFHLETTGTWPTLFTERIKLEKIFLNLIGNAIQHHDDTQGKIIVNCLSSERMVTYTVSDDGPGIKPLHHESIFEMFQVLHSKDSNPTIGAGLAITKKIIEEQGGTISVQSNDRNGTTFIFTWPVK